MRHLFFEKKWCWNPHIRRCPQSPPQSHWHHLINRHCVGSAHTACKTSAHTHKDTTEVALRTPVTYTHPIHNGDQKTWEWEFSPFHLMWKFPGSERIKKLGISLFLWAQPGVSGHMVHSSFSWDWSTKLPIWFISQEQDWAKATCSVASIAPSSCWAGSIYRIEKKQRRSSPAKRRNTPTRPSYWKQHLKYTWVSNSSPPIRLPSLSQRETAVIQQSKLLLISVAWMAPTLVFGQVFCAFEGSRSDKRVTNAVSPNTIVPRWIQARPFH